MIENRPPRLSIAIACRKIPETPAFIRWRVKGALQIIDQTDLSFTREEITALFTDLYSFPITPEQSEIIFSYTDGWIIALQMIWQRLQASRSRQLDRILAELPTALADVFNFLAQEVLQRQPENVQHFLLSSAVLRQLEANACDALPGVLAAIRASGALDETRRHAEAEAKLAREAIAPLPPSTFRDSLVQLASFAVARDF